MLAVGMEQTFGLLNWAQFPGVLSMMNKKQNQFKIHTLAPDVYKPGEIRKFNFHGNIHHRYTFFCGIPHSDLLLCLSFVVIIQLPIA